MTADGEIPKGYKLTEVGVIPEEWEARKLGDLARGVFRGASPRPIDSPIWFDENSTIGWVRISDVTRSDRYLQETTQRLSQAGVRNSRFVPSGSLIMSICATVGRPIETRLDVCIHDGFVVFDHLDADQAFLYHVLKELEPRWSGKGQTGSQMNLNTALIKNTIIPLPSTKAEQEAIAEALSDADTFIESLEQLLAKKRQLKQGAMQELLTGKRRLPGFSGDWEVGPIASFSAFVTKGSTPTTYGFNWVGDGIRFLRSECVSAEGLDLAQSMFISEIAHTVLHRGEVRAGDILMTITGNVGRVVLLAADFGTANINQHIARIRIADCNVSSVFVFHWLSQATVRTNYTLITTGQAYPQISLKQVRETLVPLPSLPEQTAIATVLSDMDAEIAALEAKLTKARQIKQGMMQDLLTGRIRLV